MPHLGLVMTFQPSMVGFCSSVEPPRGLAVGEEACGGAEALFDGLLSSALVSLSPSSFMTTTPVTTAATTTAVAATMAIRVVFFLPPSPSCGGIGGPGGAPTGYCGTVGCWYGLGCCCG